MDTCHKTPHASLVPERRAQSPGSHGQLPADISDAILREGVQCPSQMLKLFVLVIKLNFIVTLSRCYCTSSDCPRLDFIIEAVYESLGLCHCTSPSYNSLLPLQSGGPQRAGRVRLRQGEGENHRTHITTFYFSTLICNLINTVRTCTCTDGTTHL